MVFNFAQPAEHLYDNIEHDAGKTIPPTTHRPHTQFWPNWDYICTPSASTNAVVAALTQTTIPVPEWVWEPLMRTHCPRAYALLHEHHETVERWRTGRTPSLELDLRVAVQVNLDLGGYEVIRDLDTLSEGAELERTERANTIRLNNALIETLRTHQLPSDPS